MYRSLAHASCCVIFESVPFTHYARQYNNIYSANSEHEKKRLRLFATSLYCIIKILFHYSKCNGLHKRTGLYFNKVGAAYEPAYI